MLKISFHFASLKQTPCQEVMHNPKLSADAVEYRIYIDAYYTYILCNFMYSNRDTCLSRNVNIISWL